MFPFLLVLISVNFYLLPPFCQLWLTSAISFQFCPVVAQYLPIVCPNFAQICPNSFFSTQFSHNFPQFSPNLPKFGFFHPIFPQFCPLPPNFAMFSHPNRSMAEDGVDAAIRTGQLAASPCVTEYLPLTGADDFTPALSSQLTQQFVRMKNTNHRLVPGALDSAVAKHLAGAYGGRAELVARIAQVSQRPLTYADVSDDLDS